MFDAYSTTTIHTTNLDTVFFHFLNEMTSKICFSDILLHIWFQGCLLAFPNEDMVARFLGKQIGGWCEEDNL